LCGQLRKPKLKKHIRVKVYKGFNAKVVKILSEGGVGVVPTDTIYGLVGSALFRTTVSRIYCLKKRNPKKPLIVLISSPEEFEYFGIKLSTSQSNLISPWPNRSSIIFPCRQQKFKYLHRGTGSIAFRIPDNKKLITLLKLTGPLVAPSANPEGELPAQSIERAIKYFDGEVEFYVNGGRKNKKPSSLFRLINNELISLVRK